MMATKKRTTKKATAKHAKENEPKGLSQTQAAIKVLGQARKPMSCKEMIEAMAKKGLWSSPGGKTPEATLYSSILRDLKKGKDARFKKAAPGRFTLAGK
ncbi:MAG: winged helix-turn-helix domain-containing protein [Pirellulaceae bacterium]